ncbi:MAG: glycosyltransferase family protein [Thermoleophilaceae bacterium]
MTASTRVLFYSHDSFGLGHLRRTLALARSISDQSADADSLVLTGSGVASGYLLPPRVDVVKLPVVTKDEHGHYRAERLSSDFERVRMLRSQLALAAAEGFEPHAAVIDKTPLGLRGELVPALESLRASGRCRLVLGLRDIEDSPDNVRRQWQGTGVRDAIRRYYDAILVYGPLSSPDALDCMGWDDLGVPVHHVGYVGPPMPGAGPIDLPDEYLLAAAGGGADGRDMLAGVLEAIRSKPLPCSTVLVTGPLMSARDLEYLLGLARGLRVRVYEFRADMEAVVAGARAAVTMAGYNTVSELLSAGTPALLIPRVRPREEQLVRARALADAGVAEMLHPDDLSPALIRAKLQELLERGANPVRSRPHDGARHAARLVLDLAGSQAVHEVPARAAAA